MYSRHAMPFGATVLPGHVHFGLWAPDADRIDLCIEARGRETRLKMQRVDAGWFRLDTDRAEAGTLYRYLIDGQLRVPDPASRFQPDDVHGASEVIDPATWSWSDTDWAGRDWDEACIYELHVGAFSDAGTFAAVEARLDYLVELGVTAIELMPVADFPGARNWGYDGALPFAPDNRYGRPDDLKSLVQAAHARGLMVLLDVVYNHFGPEGNYLHHYASTFFTDRYHTPWGSAINFDGAASRCVRAFFIHNALYWIEEFHMDGLRLDAVHAVYDRGTPDILQELATAVHSGPGARRKIHLILENDNNAAHYLERNGNQPRWYTAQWNDDLHHALHVLVSGETGGYYQDYADDPVDHLARCLREGFAYQGERSRYRDGVPRGESSAQLPPTAFVSFVQNHDQIGNRARGERITALADADAVRAATAIVLLAPTPPLLFMGQEWGAEQAFPFFCDFGPDLAERVSEGRRREFARFPEFADKRLLANIPDPAAPGTFAQAVLDWRALDSPSHREWLALHRRLLELRRLEVVPLLKTQRLHHVDTKRLGPHGLRAAWTFGYTQLVLEANLSSHAQVFEPHNHAAQVLFSTFPDPATTELPPWSARWSRIDTGEAPGGLE